MNMVGVVRHLAIAEAGEELGQQQLWWAVQTDLYQAERDSTSCSDLLG
jgi:hypothetical protein